MKEETRGLIESLIDDALRSETEFVDKTKWIGQEIPISSPDQLALGYIIGVFDGLAKLCIALPPDTKLKIIWGEGGKEKRIINKIIKRRLPEIVDRINKELNR